MAKRVIIMVLDSFGIGPLQDAGNFGDANANTLGSIDSYCEKNGLKLHIPNLLKLGLGRAYSMVNNKVLFCDDNNYQLNGAYGACTELSSGKDTTSGHWEIAGCPVLFDWGYFQSKTNSFPQELLDKIVIKANLGGYLGNCHASGTDIIRDLGDEHIKTGYPIFYTSADSVFQIACHEDHFGLENLYKLCKIVREELAPYNIARVIARPFAGIDATSYKRTSNRKDYSLVPHATTMFDVCQQNGGTNVSIGKIADIYAHKNTGIEIKASGLDDLCNKTKLAINDHKNDKTLIMTNLVDFDMLYGHRRDVVGYKNALEFFDDKIPGIISSLQSEDMLILTADHGCDPTYFGTDHTREHIPFLVYWNGRSGNLGVRSSFADIGQSVCEYLDLPKLPYGLSGLDIFK